MSDPETLKTSQLQHDKTPDPTANMNKAPTAWGKREKLFSLGVEKRGPNSVA
jgi:hypothetical protein